MIKKGSPEWQDFLEKLNFSKAKSNRDVLCLKCWRIMKYEESVKHKMLYPMHRSSILTSKSFASEEKFVELAHQHGKCIIQRQQSSLNEFAFKYQRGEHG